MFICFNICCKEWCRSLQKHYLELQRAPTLVNVVTESETIVSTNHHSKATSMPSRTTYMTSTRQRINLTLQYRHSPSTSQAIWNTQVSSLDPDDLGFDKLQEPTRPTTTDQIDISIYHNDRKEWREKVARRKASMEHSFSMVLEQCSLSIRNRLESLPSYSAVKNPSM